MLFEDYVDKIGVQRVFGDVLPVIEAWCKKNNTKLMVSEFWPGEHKTKVEEFGLAWFDFIRPISLMASDIGELLDAVYPKYFVDIRVKRIHIGKRTEDKWDFRHADGCVCFVCRGRSAANSNNR